MYSLVCLLWLPVQIPTMQQNRHLRDLELLFIFLINNTSAAYLSALIATVRIVANKLVMNVFSVSCGTRVLAWGQDLKAPLYTEPWSIYDYHGK